MFYHASPTPGLSLLTPHVSNHGKSLVYFSTKRENVLVYLSNAVEKFCLETGFSHTGSFQTWGSYGFNKDGVLVLEEYYPNATWDTYHGVSGYIYSTEDIGVHTPLPDIPFAVTAEHPVAIEHCKPISDAYEAIERAVQAGVIRWHRYEENSPAMCKWIEETIHREYTEAEAHPEYRHFLRGKFDFLR